MEAPITVPEGFEKAAQIFHEITGKPVDGNFAEQHDKLRQTIRGERDITTTGDKFCQVLDCCVQLSKLVASAKPSVFPAGSVNDLNNALLGIIRDFLQICISYDKIKKAKLSRNPLPHLILAARAVVKSDYGIMDNLKHIDKLTSVARNLKSDDVYEAITALQSSQVHQDDRSRIIQSLPCQQTDFWRTWVDSAFHHYRQGFVSEAATWLQNDPAFKEWSNLGSSSGKRILIIQSRHDGSGKSSICSEAIERLRDQVHQWLASYMPRTGRQSIFIILDGIDQIHSDDQQMEEKTRTALREIIRQVSKPSKGGLDIRLLLSCRESYIAERIPEEEQKAVSWINLADYCQDMANAFIDKKLGWICYGFDSTQNAKDLKWPWRLKEKLLHHSNGNIGMLSALFRDISDPERRSSLDEFDRRLDNYLDNYKRMIPAHIQTLNQRLNDDEIEDLNEIIACIVLMKQWPTLTQIRGILGLRREGRPAPDEDELRDRFRYYGQLLSVSEDILFSETTLNFFLECEQRIIPSFFFEPSAENHTGPIDTGSEDGAGGPNINGIGGTQKIHKSEIDIVRNALVFVCGDDLYRRFDFDKFFAFCSAGQIDSGPGTWTASRYGMESTRLSSPATYRNFIGFGSSDGHTRIACSLLRSLQASEETENSANDSLRDYAIKNVFWHISKIDHEPDSGSSRRESQICEMLQSLFTGQHAIKLWLSQDWGDSDRFSNWLKSAVETTLDWDKQCSVGKAFEQLAACHKQAGKLQYERDDVGAKVAEVKRIAFKEEYWPADTHSSSLQLAEMRALETILYYEDYHQVIEQSKNLLERDDANWTVHWYLAQALVNENRILEALRHCDKILIILGHPPSGSRQERPHELGNILQFHWRTLQLAPSEVTVARTRRFKNSCEKLLEVFPDHYALIDTLIGTMGSDEKVQRELYDDLSKRQLPQRQPGITVMTGLLHNHATKLDFHRNLVNCYRKEPEDLKIIYKESIQAAEKSCAIWYDLRFYLGLAQHYQSPRKDKVRARKGVSLGCRLYLKASESELVHKEECLRIWEDDANMFLGLPKPNKEDANYIHIARTITERVAGMLASSYTSTFKKGSAFVRKRLELLEQINRRKRIDMASHGSPDTFLDHAIARLYNLDGQIDKSHRQIQESITSGIRLLSDDVAHNDWQGCLVLLESLKAVNDNKHALAACGLLYNLTKQGEAQECANKAKNAGMDMMVRLGEKQVTIKEWVKLLEERYLHS
ncbi:Neutral permease protein [Diaporthe amygdali]|uniref:Neutral permease protein n=1 Tax=Phomopsis amygdali TaxID=1214568 RepID=UPI0022FDF583|nr:Neutral permease protein [Diaporthe amygdali]KAJ0107457.1 Neutral permease protein [Diaporthe amygdali]